MEEEQRDERGVAQRDVLANPAECRQWSEEDLARLREALTEADPPEALTIREELPPDVERALKELEEEYEGEASRIRHDASEKRLDLLRGFIGRVASFVDLDTKEKWMEFALELFPYVGAAYAITGRRLRIQRNEQAGTRTLSLEPISWVDRGIYLLGELWVSGHVIRGVKEAILKKGKKAVAKELAAQAGKRAGEKLVHRAKDGAKRMITGEPSPIQVKK